DELVREHHLDGLGCGIRSPFAKLVDMDAQILGLGLSPMYMTFLHVVEDLDLANFPRQIYGDRKREWTVIDESGERLSIEIPIRDDRVLSTMNLNRLSSHLSPKALCPFAVYGVPCFVGHAPTLLTELKDLTRNGIVLYA
ncbi:MAG: AAC(3) family N-acetyltransferase, partial [Planctomycetes bacterium]|nr:AAC(3) family N-acetyltransferase [Planctomycetota bacterium]